jgi:hypothetical protein
MDEISNSMYTQMTTVMNRDVLFGRQIPIPQSQDNSNGFTVSSGSATHVPYTYQTWNIVYSSVPEGCIKMTAKEETKPKEEPATIKIRKIKFHIAIATDATFVEVHTKALLPCSVKLSAKDMKLQMYKGTLTTLAWTEKTLLGMGRKNPKDILFEERVGQKAALANAIADLDEKQRAKVWDYYLRHFPDPNAPAKKETPKKRHPRKMSKGAMIDAIANKVVEKMKATGTDLSDPNVPF